MIEAGEGSANLIDLAKNIMAKDKVLYHGHAILAIGARTEAIAEQALDLVKVEYELLPPVMDIKDAIKADASFVKRTAFYRRAY